jgi:hypothetical protein
MLQPSHVLVPDSVDNTLIASLAKLWPHREHESNAIKHLACCFGLYRWRALDLSEQYPGKQVRYCFWCPKIRVDGVIYEP